ncbi:hypothetical protein SFR_4437 [Streptomyces sp. FR-008]|nr:hypothetical protein SFR_4437 [Streptomyces sp. FR-008]
MVPAVFFVVVGVVGCWLRRSDDVENWLLMVPLLAAALCSPRVTALFGVLALLLNRLFTVVAPGPNLRVEGFLLDVCVVLLAVLVAVLRSRTRDYVVRLQTAVLAAREVVVRPIPRGWGGVESATSYLPADTEARMGGDFYDVLTTPHGARIVLGDVQGKGGGLPVDGRGRGRGVPRGRLPRAGHGRGRRPRGGRPAPPQRAAHRRRPGPRAALRHRRRHRLPRRRQPRRGRQLRPRGASRPRPRRSTAPARGAEPAARSGRTHRQRAGPDQPRPAGTGGDGPAGHRRRHRGPRPPGRVLPPRRLGPRPPGVGRRAADDGPRRTARPARRRPGRPHRGPPDGRRHPPRRPPHGLRPAFAEPVEGPPSWRNGLSALKGALVRLPGPGGPEEDAGLTCNHHRGDARARGGQR